MAEEFKSGVQWFEVGEINQKVYFPNGIIKCINCEHLFWEKGTDRARCYLAKRIIFAPNYPELPDFCPVKFTGEIVGKPKSKGE